MSLQGELVRIGSLTQVEQDGMFGLMDAYFEGMDRGTFEQDLQEKDWVILLRLPDNGEIHGFSTQRLFEANANGSRVRVLFSGDTIVDRNYWGQTELMRVWGRFVLRLVEQHGGMPLYWFLICMGYRTYRFLPVFFWEYYPRHDTPTPARMQELLHTVARAKHPVEYDPSCGVIRPRCGVRIRAGIGDVDSRALRNPEVGFFVKCNPGHAAGDELACIAPLSAENFKPSALKIIRRGKSAYMEF